MNETGFHEEKIPQKYQSSKDNLKQDFVHLTPIERIVYAAYQISTLREIGTALRKSKNTISRIYLRACEKIEAQKNA